MVLGRTVLVLESDRAAMFPLAAALRHGGWAVVTAQDAALAMNVARRQKPDAVVINSELAGGGGLVALKRLRSSVYTTLIPVICIVPERSEVRAEFGAAGAQEMITPPGDPQAIGAALQRHLARREGVFRVPPAVLGSERREAALKESKLLDSPYEEWFDRLTQLTTRLVGVPTALVSVVDKDRQFFKSHAGLPEPWAAARQTPLSHSFCQWVVGGNEEISVGDAREHPVLRNNSAIKDLGVIAYAGVPFTSSGEAIGSFCAIDSRPREWTEDQLATLRDLSVILQSFVTMRIDAVDSPSKTTAVANGIAAATHALLRCEPVNHSTERLELSRMIEQMSHKLVQLCS